ncbi:hypothetical protein [Ochrobactrum quorumnocens]|uniref:Alpha-glutamyl/putrescinyl thymine pyrophosphorylase clade 3 domain-containing protein n=1 Tax=Ochrobactrum quorumnocens TaxID=271865 RepID=A0A5N1K0G9_9HYPH|nr:hypothetical protein [[Ochrobactrum] quorumnocens]KAA9369583.1 hypothetical protein F3W84_05450 [[Ochrobactrum] quorumnocens]
MKWPNWNKEKVAISNALVHHSQTTRPLLGIANNAALEALSMQFIASIRREEYYRVVQLKVISPTRADPNSPLFDAERAVAYHIQNGNTEEACWLIFLMTHFARPVDTGWLRLKDVYGGLGHQLWTWQIVRANPAVFIGWLNSNWTTIRGKFGNHRKYESLRPSSNRSFDKVLDSYLQMIGNSHIVFFASAVQSAGNNPETIFEELYKTVGKVFTFGRLAKFDYLALIGRYSIAPIKPGSAYLVGATGPATGAKLLFDGNVISTTPTKTLQNWLTDLDKDLSVGMQVMEDAICNWQKSPLNFVHFKG